MDISIVIPAYNVESYILHTLRSLAGQTDRRFETIIVDDGSTDRTADVVQAFLDAGSLPRARLIRTANGGVSRARNRGLREASGTYVLFLDGDDYTGPDLVRQLCGAAERHTPQAIACRFLEVDERHETLYDFYQDKPPLPDLVTGAETMKRIFTDRCIRVPLGGAAFDRRLLLERGVSFMPNCANGEDQEFIYKALACCDRVTFVDEPLYYYVQRGSSITYSYNIRKFDFAAAFGRAASFIERMNASGSAQLETAVHALRNRHCVENYFYNLETCLNSAARPSLRRLLRDIDRQYPGLNREMRAKIKRHYTEAMSMTHTIRGFLIMPELYQAIKGVKLALAQLRSRAV